MYSQYLQEMLPVSQRILILKDSATKGVREQRNSSTDKAIYAYFMQCISSYPVDMHQKG